MNFIISFLAGIFLSAPAFAAINGNHFGTTTARSEIGGISQQVLKCTSNLETYILGQTSTSQGQLYVKTSHQNCGAQKGAAHLLTIKGTDLIDPKSQEVVGQTAGDHVQFSVTEGTAQYSLQFTLTAVGLVINETKSLPYAEVFETHNISGTLSK